MKNRLSVIVLACAGMFAGQACTEGQLRDCEKGKFEMTSDGKKITVVSVDAILTLGGKDNPGAKRLAIQVIDADENEYALKITDHTNQHKNAITIDDVYVSMDRITSAADNMFYMDGSSIGGRLSDGTLDITYSDNFMKQVSGVFSLVSGEHGGEFSASGSFTDICYTVIQEE